jgi:predicted ATP-grasp superfamily ATP-dependent carboligase
VAFVTDALLRKSVVVCQALGRRGIEVVAGGTTRLSPAFYSRYCDQSVVYPCPVRAPDDFVEFMLDYLQRNHQDVLLPTDDATLALVAAHRDDFERVTHVPIPDSEQLAHGLDKAPVMCVAARLGIPHPRTLLPENEAQVQSLAETLRPPFVIKPRKSSGGRGIVYVTPSDDLSERWHEVHQTFPLPMLQECVPNGRKFDVGLLIDQRGKCVASFVQEELRHFPIRDGLSTMQISVRRPDLVERAVRLLEAIGWYGLAEVEFMEDPRTGEVLLLEVNPRFWASIQLAVACGVDFPYLLYRLARGKRIDEVHAYDVGQRCRWVLPGDLLHFMANSDRLRMDPSFFDFNAPDTIYDGIYADDLGATAGVVASTAHYLFKADLWRMLLRNKRAAPPVALRTGRSGAAAA